MNVSHSGQNFLVFSDNFTSPVKRYYSFLLEKKKRCLSNKTTQLKETKVILKKGVIWCKKYFHFEAVGADMHVSIAMPDKPKY